MVQKYRKKPIIIEAVKYTGHNGWYIIDWAKDNIIENPISIEKYGTEPKDRYLSINTLEGTMIANVGDYIIRGIKDELYPCKPDIFEATYDII